MNQTDAPRPAAPALPRVVILAGGRSSRLGRDKATVEIDGVPSLLRVRAAAAAVVGPGLVEVHDQPAGGPLGALLEALARWPDRDVVLLACDMPRVDAAIVGRLTRVADGAAGGPDAWVARVDGVPQPLAARYARAAAKGLAAAWAAGERSLVRALGRLDVTWVDDLPAAALVDFDTPEELAALQAAVGAERAGGDHL